MELRAPIKHNPILGVEIVGYGTALPSGYYDNDALIRRGGLEEVTSSEWISDNTGISGRYISDSELGETTASLSAISGRAAMDMAGYAPNQIDSIILATTTPDRPIPATSSTVQRLLGAKGCSAVDMNAACAGFGYALVDGYSNINSGEGPSLVIGTDLLTRVTDPHDRGTAILFGDGSGAVLLQKSEREDAGLLGWYKTGNGELEEHLYCDYGEFIQMNGQSVYRNAIPLVVETSRAALEDAELETSQIKLMIPHQANKRIIDSAAKRLKITDDKVVWTGREYANTSSASIPLAFAEAMRDGRIERGDKILMVAFGAGMTGVAMVIQY